MTEAIKDFPSAECDVLLRDIGLPDGNGSDCCHGLPEGANRCHRDDRLWDGRRPYKEQSCWLSLPHLKPFDPEELEATFKEVVSTPAA
jgi:hypothetical protein